jgi:metal-responsive CopG/Arc/MetJ family transcriptional regulator
MQEVSNEETVPRTKTSIYIDEELWREFSIFVVKKHGNRAISDTLEKAIKEYIERHDK